MPNIATAEDVQVFVEWLKNLTWERLFGIFESWFGTAGDEQDMGKEELIKEIARRMIYDTEPEKVAEIIGYEMNF